ncbi:16S rRNA (cytosine(1402)-N(4))-methyltransferase, partial [Francisella tularensis subsp. holarctica]|uniref:16S rRNA (cytosine(1402)-N(4))-methyltransferase n=1 Tax=Francisella tularensis TaxID=263 RepID=UPI002381CF2D
ELKDLEAFLENILAVIKSGGRIAAICFHSLEDRIVIQKFSALINPKQELNSITMMLPQDSSQIKLKWITKNYKANEV